MQAEVTLNEESEFPELRNAFLKLSREAATFLVEVGRTIATPLETFVFSKKITDPNLVLGSLLGRIDFTNGSPLMRDFNYAVKSEALTSALDQILTEASQNFVSSRTDKGGVYQNNDHESDGEVARKEWQTEVARLLLEKDPFISSP